MSDEFRFGLDYLAGATELLQRVRSSKRFRVRTT